MEVNSIDDLYMVLDKLTESIDWDVFYTKRNMKAPFLVNNTLPDKVIAEFIKEHKVRNAIEFGCGEGRNAVYLAKHGVDVLAIDQSEAAIRQAKGYADNLENVKFIAGDCLELDYGCRQYDVAIDSGLFHHLSPHRRLQYRDILKSVVKEKGYLVLLCFSAGAGGADEVDDLEFYSKRNTGVAFSEQRIRNFFEKDFEILHIEQCGQSVTEEYIDIPYLFGCVMRKR